MRFECVVMCRDCNTPKGSPTSECANPNCPGKLEKRVKWGPPNSRNGRLKI